MKTKLDNLLNRQFSSKAVLIIGSAVPFLLYFILFLSAGNYPFGDIVALDYDAFHQYLPFLTEFRRKLVSSESLFYSFSGGLGYDFWATIAYYAASPLNLLLALLPDAHVCDAMVWMTVFKASLCGGIFSWYLYKQHSGTPFFAVAFGTVYAFSSYIVSYKYNLMWLDSIAVVPLVMYGLEKLVRARHTACYLFSLFYAIWCNYYIGYMICIFSCLYLVFLFVTEEGLDNRQRFTSIALFFVSSLAAGGMASVLLVPAFLALQKSTAMVTGESTGFRLLNNVISMLRAHYLESESFRTSYHEGDIHLYCGTFILLLAPLYFSDSKIRKKLRISYAVFLGFLLLSFTFRPLNFAWHGFHNQTALPNRFSFLYNIMILKMCYSVLPGLKTIGQKRLNRVVLGVFAVSVLFAVWDLVAKHSFKVSYLSFLCIAFYTVLLYEIRSSPKKETQFSLLLCAALILEAGGFGAFDVFLYEEGWERSTFVAWQEDTQQLLNNQKTDGFYRCDIDTEITNFVTFVGGHGVSLFNSTIQNNICEFLKDMNFPTDLNMVNNLGGTKLANDLLGVRYFISEDVDAETWNGFKKVSSLNGKTLYQNPDALSLGFLVPEKVASWQSGLGSGMELQNNLARILCGMDELYTLQRIFAGESNTRLNFTIPEKSSIYVNVDDISYKQTWKTPEATSVYERRVQNLFLPAEASDEEQQATLIVRTLHNAPFTGCEYSCLASDYRIIIDTLSRSQMEDISVSGNCVSGSVSAPENSLLLLSIPYNKGWQISIDGSPAEYQEVAGALIGIPVHAGTHFLQMKYVPQGFKIGGILSFTSLLLALAVLLMENALQISRPEKNHLRNSFRMSIIKK